MYPYFLFTYWRATLAHSEEYIREYFPCERLPEVEEAVRLFAPWHQDALSVWRRTSLPHRQAVYDDALGAVRLAATIVRLPGHVTVAYEVTT